MPSVRDVILRRFSLVEHGTQKHSEFRDGQTLGLVLQGGGLRGAYSAAALSALSARGGEFCFNHVVGTSAGAINGAYFLSGQAEMSKDVYVEDLVDPKFVNFLRFTKIVDIDYLVDDVIAGSRLLNMSSLLTNGTPLYISMTDSQTGNPYIIQAPADMPKLLEAFRATAALPVVYRRQVIVDGRKCIDGSVSNSIPLLKAIELGCTHILVVLTRPMGPVWSPRRRLTNWLEHLAYVGYPAPIRHALLSQRARLGESLELIESGTILTPSGSAVQVEYVAPTNPAMMIGQITTNSDKLRRFVRMGISDMTAYLQSA